MAIKTFTANLNGGDLITADTDLIFKIYGSADSYTTPIATTGSHTSDSDVTVAGDVVTIENVDVGSETGFKISSIDEASNEAILSDEYITELDVTTATLVGTKDVAIFNATPMGGRLSPDGTEWIYIDHGTRDCDNAVLDTLFDIESLNNVGGRIINLGAYTSSAKCASWNNDGTKAYVSSSTEASIFEFDCPTPYSVTGATHSATKDLSSILAGAGWHSWSTDGTKLYWGTQVNATMWQLSVGTPWDVSTINATPVNTLDVDDTNGITELRWYDFSDNGKQMFLGVKNVTDFVYQYSLATAWDISTATYDNKSFAAPGYCSGVCIMTAQKKMYLTNQTGQEINEYDLN